MNNEERILEFLKQLQADLGSLTPAELEEKFHQDWDSLSEKERIFWADFEKLTNPGEDP